MARSSAPRATANGSNETPATRALRCAIYTRKSTEEGLQQDFNSLDAQREAAEAFILSQKREGWQVVADHFDDGGYTGANMDRPALKRLLGAVEDRSVDCVVVYKVDRLSRSLMDFARIVEVCDQNGVSFVSVTQQFNTTTSIGRLTLNILLSFAQFEREIISERTRDKMSAARRKGKWIGGHPVLGYDIDSKGGRLIVNPAEAEQVRTIFGLYLELGSLLPVLQEADRRGLRTKLWTTVDGKVRGGERIAKGTMHGILIPGGISLPAISIPAAGGGSVSGGVGGIGAGASIPIGIGGAASPGAPGVSPADIFNLPTAHAGASMTPLGMILGANQKGGTSGVYSLFSKEGFSKTLQNLKGTVWNQKVFDDAGGGLSGGIQGVAKSPAAGAAGMMLAMNGLFGSRRGTWGGIAESTAGGALIGEQIGGPLGAGIGAGAGFLAGVGEKLAGVESPENEAKRLVKQLYSISIDNSMAKQIAGIAQQKYAGHVSIAVRDPDVRKMLMLYSEATGQKMPLSATTPQSGSLAEMGGKLYQQATYVNGTPYTFQSNLPVAGGFSTGTYPTPGPMTLQVNVSGQGAAQFVAGQVVTPEFVQSQWSSAASASNGRLQNSAIIQQPGLVIA